MTRREAGEGRGKGERRKIGSRKRGKEGLERK